MLLSSGWSRHAFNVTCHEFPGFLFDEFLYVTLKRRCYIGITLISHMIDIHRDLRHTHDGVRTVIFSVTYKIVILSPEIMYIGKLSPNAKSRFVTAIRTCGWGDWLAIHLVGGTCLWCNRRGPIRWKLRRPVITGPFSIAADQKTPLRSDFRLRYGNQISFARHSGRLSRGKILQNRTYLPLIRPHIRSWSKRKADCRQASWRYEHNAFLACIVSRWRSCLDSYLFRYATFIAI